MWVSVHMMMIIIAIIISAANHYDFEFSIDSIPRCLAIFSLLLQFSSAIPCAHTHTLSLSLFLLTLPKSPLPPH
jgi:hypothetical protein